MDDPIRILKQIRKAKEISIVELAAKMGISQAYIVRLERGEIQPTKEQIEVIRSFLEKNE